ncbi:Hsp20 family protein [Candidatus Haliotispira prima]|uniref:Hsp20 family protein n=1 Tax=Candidatus Haliotispira prima TaxID=3034016 RepID=A0ABY8MFU6_9SPIO|nr:Hsp20 family protein [Candidatus Haliotispira prima]
MFYNSSVFTQTPALRAFRLLHDEPYHRYQQQPSGNIREEEGAFVIEIVIPGIKRDALEISLEQDDQQGDSLSIQVKNPEDREGETQTQAPDFGRKFYLGKALDREHIEARLEDGILSIRIARKEPVKKSIAVA